MDPHCERVGRSLRRIDGSGRFSASHRELGLGLRIAVEGIGTCPFPLRSEHIEALIERAEPSPFGHRDQTVHDTSVRDSWEIPGADIELDAKAWQLRMGRGLAEIQEALGFGADAELIIELSKLVIYGPGQFFAPHRDTEKHPNMCATLVVVLPTMHVGGQMVVEHGSERVVYDTRDPEKYVTFLGFYADCLHEIRPVESGHRIALTYTIRVASTATDAVASGGTDLEQSLRAFFERGAAPGWLVYLLDHQYSVQSLDWSRLKGADRSRVEALRAAAENIGCACFLALADVRAQYETSEEGGSPGTVPPNGYGPLADLEVNLERWIDAEGRRCRGTDAIGFGDSLVSTIDGHGRTAYHLAYEPWTGNEGGTADVWYRQTAIVMVPRQSALDAEIREFCDEGEAASPRRRHRG